MNKRGFTLPEVLITLLIVGIIASITIPILISNYQEKVRVTQLRVLYSMLSQAFDSMINENGEIKGYNTNARNRIDKVVELLPNYLSTKKVCKAARSGGCTNLAREMRVMPTMHT